MEVKGLVVLEDAHCDSDRLEPGWLKAAEHVALEHVANRPILHHVAVALHSAGVNEVLVASSARWSRQARECLADLTFHDAWRVGYLHQEAPMDLGDALRLAAPVIDSSACVVHQATGLLGEPLRPFLACLRSTAPDLVVTVNHDLGANGRLGAGTQPMLHLAKLRPHHETVNMAGVCLFGPRALRCASTAEWRSDGDTDLTGVAEQIAAAGGSFRLSPVNSWRQYTGDPLDLLELNRIALDRLDAGFHRSADDGNCIEGRVWIHKLASVRTSVIVGPAVIGPGARVADAYIGPYTSIGAGARIEGAEIERSIVAADASIIHTGGRLVASVVGRNSRVFRDFSLPRALRLRVGAGTEVALC